MFIFIVKVDGAGKGTLSLSLQNTTILRQISMIVCNKMNLDKFHTQIAYYGSRPEQLSETASVRQIPIKNGNELFARVKFTRSPTAMESTLYQSNMGLWKDPILGMSIASEGKKRAIEECIDTRVFAGLTIHGSCENPRCQEYQVPTFYSRGYGYFTMTGLIRGNFCDLCPHKDIDKIPMRVIDVIFRDCSWKMEGYIV